MTLDQTDLTILSILQNDGRVTNQALSDQVGLSTSPCWRKVKHLEETGIIEGYTARLNRRRIDLGVLAFIRIKIDSHNELEAEQFVDEV